LSPFFGQPRRGARLLRADALGQHEQVKS